MVTVTIKEDSKQAKALIAMLRTFSFVEVHEQSNFNSDTVKAIEDAKMGTGITKTTDHADLMQKLRS